MFKSMRLRRKFVALLSLCSLTLNIFQPVILAFTFATPTYAQEVPSESPTPAPEPSVAVENTPSPEPTIAPSAEPSVSPSPTSSPDVSPTPTATPDTTLAPSATPTPTPSDSQPSNTPVPSDSIPAPPSSPSPSPSASSVNLDEQLHISVIENTEATSIEEYDLEVTETGSAQLATDKLDYAPTDTALITGNGFLPNTTYSLTISSSDEPATSTTVEVTTDEIGTLYYAYQLDGIYRPNYKVEAFLGSTLVATITFTDAEGGSAAVPFNDSFGSSDVNNVSSWQDSDGNGSATYIEGSSESRPGSPTTGHVRIGEDDWVCRTINASGYQSLQLSYYWRGDGDAENDDDAIVEYKISGNCNDGTGWTSITTHEISQQTSSWSSQQNHNLSSGLNNQTFKIRFRTSSSNDNEQFRLDDVSVSGSTIVVNTAPVITEGSSTSVNMSSNGAPTPFALTLHATDSDLPAQTLTWSISSGASHGTATASGTGASKVIGYTPSANYVGNDSFVVQVSDGNGGTDTITVNVTISQAIVANPNLNATCGIDIGLIIDTSTSIDSGELTTMKSALNTFVSAFTGTPTQMAVVSFDDSAVVQSGFTSNLASLTSVINGISGSGYTNWEDAIHDTRVLFPNRADKPDLIVFTTDGDPTASSAGGNDTNQPNAHLSPAITEANLAKSAGIRMVTLGIGMTGGDSQTRLQQISSADAFYNSADFSTLQSTLQDLVTDLCGSTVSVTKIIDTDGKLNTTNDRTAASGWTFNIGGQSGQVTDVNGQTPAVTLTPASGYSVTETVQPGYSLLSASCTGATSNGTSNGTTGVTGISVGANDIASCTFINAPVQKIDICHATDSHSNPYIINSPDRSGDVSGHDGHNGDVWYPGIADHSWGDIIPPFDYVGGSYPGQNWTTQGQAIYNNSCNLPQGKLTVAKVLSPANDPGLFNLTIGGTTYASNVGNGGTTGQINVNPATYTVGETAGSNTDLSNYTAVYGGDCNTQGQVTVGIGETKSCTITNTRKTGSITFLKEVIGGDAEPADWEFNVLNIGTFQNGVFVFNTGTYSVTEVSQQVGYTLTAVDGSVCTAMNVQNGSATLNVTSNGGTCKFTNTRDTGSIKVNKLLDNDGNSSFETTNPASFTWSLDGVGTNTMGTTVSNVPTTIPTVSHNVNENPVLGYHLVGWYKAGTQYSCSNPQGTTLPVAIDVTKDATAEVTFCNRKDTGSIKIIKAVPGNNEQDFTFSGNNNLGSFTLDDNGSESTSNGGKRSYKDFSGIASGSYTFTETNIPSTWVLDSLVCTGDSGYQVSGNSVTVNLDHGENVVCTFNNRQPKGTITIVKDAISNSDDNFRFDTNLQGGDFELEDDGNDNNGGTEESKTWNIPVGSYWVDERSSNDWQLTSLTCSGDDNIDINKNTGKVIIDLDDGENVLCTYENTKLGKIKGYKFHDQNADGDQDWFDFNLSGWTITLNDDDETTTSNHWLSYGWYQFDDLLPGEYTVCEEQQEGWNNSTPLCRTINLSAGETEYVAFGNYQKGSITVIKDVVTYEGNPVEDETGTEFNFSIDDLDSSFSLSDGESYTIENVSPGYYQIEEETNELYDFAGCYIQGQYNYHHDWYGQNNRNWQSDDSSFRVSSGDDLTIVCKNKQKTGDLEVTKYNDQNGNGEWDKGELVLGDWEITLGELSETTSESGKAYFNNLLTGWYNLDETMQEGWTQTNISCGEDEEEQEELFEKVAGNVYINPGQTTYCTIGNQMDPKLTIEKINDTTGAQSPGSDVVYTLKIELAGSDVNDVFVTDTTPTGFTYKTGSWTASSNYRGDLKALLITTEPTYASPGTWTLGDMIVGEVVTLTYTADISNSVDSGTYKDIAWAYGSNSYDTSEVLAVGQNSQYVEGIFVGTDVEIKKDTQQTGSVNLEKTGDVLGASTELPATGADNIWIFLAIALFLLGSILIFGGKFMSKFFVTLLIAVSIFSVAPSVSAFESSKLSVRMESPLTPTRVNDWTLAFSSLDRDNNQITVKCYVKKTSGDFVQFDTDKVLPHGGAGSCQVNGSVLNTQGTYSFKVIASSLNGEVVSSTAIVVYDTEGPGTPTNYSKDHPTECRWIIRFKTADDGGLTTKVEIYSSTDFNFNTNDSTRVGSVAIGSNAHGEFIHDRGSDCNKTWYYVIRAFDSIGNQSGHIGDSVDHTVVVSPTPSTGALIVPLNQGSILGQADDQNTGEVMGEETTSVEDISSVAGLATKAANLAKSKVFWWVLSAIIALGILYVILKKSKTIQS